MKGLFRDFLLRSTATASCFKHQQLSTRKFTSHWHSIMQMSWWKSPPCSSLKSPQCDGNYSVTHQVPSRIPHSGGLPRKFVTNNFSDWQYKQTFGPSWVLLFEGLSPYLFIYGNFSWRKANPLPSLSVDLHKLLHYS